MSDTKNTLREMAQLTMLTGRISELHVQNIQKLPFIFFNEIKDLKVEYNIATFKDDKSYLSYYFQINKDSNDQVKRRCQDLEKAIYNLFWKGIIVEVFFNGELVYKTEDENVERSDQTT